MNNKFIVTTKAILQTLTLGVLLTTAAPFAQGSTNYDIQITLGAQIRAANLLAIIEIQDYPKLQAMKLNVSGIKGQERLIADMPFKIIELLKYDPDIEIPESSMLRIAAKAESKSGDELVYPASVNQQLLVSLTHDVLTRNKDEQTVYAIKQDAFHLVDGDTVEILYQGKVVDKLSLDEVRKQVEIDAERRNKLAAFSEPEDTNKDFLPVNEIQESTTK